MSSYEDTKRAMEEQFYSTFPGARLQAFTSSAYFPGLSFYHENITTDHIPGYIALADSPPPIPAAYPSNLASSLHYDYQAVASTSTQPSFSQQPSHFASLEHAGYFQPIVPSSTPAPALQHAVVPLPAPPTPQVLQGHQQSNVNPYSHQPTHHVQHAPETVEYNPYVALESPTALVTASPIIGGSNFVEAPYQPIIVPSQTPERLAAQRLQQLASARPNNNPERSSAHSHRQQQPQRQHIMPSPHRSASYDPSPLHHHHSPSPVVPSHGDRHVSRRSGSWGPSHPAGSAVRSSRPSNSMRLSPLPSGKRQLEKKPPLACLFCRGRKIACGPPLPGSLDKTCNQCQRRSLRCEYPSESRRGMRKKKTNETTEAPDSDQPPPAAANELPSTS